MPTARATVARAEPFADREAAESWLGRLRRDSRAASLEVERAASVLNRVLRAHRAATADPFVREVRSAQATARRVGYADGEVVAAGQLTSWVEVPTSERRRRRAEALRSTERLAGLLSGRTPQLVCEELILRARLDLEAGRGREAALQARVALEALLAEVGSLAGGQTTGAELRHLREGLVGAADAALDGELDSAQREAVETAVGRMGQALARHRASGR